MIPSKAHYRYMTATWAMLMLAVGQAAQADEAAWLALKSGGQVVLMHHTTPEQGPGKGNPLLRDAMCARETLIYSPRCSPLGDKPETLH